MPDLKPPEEIAPAPDAFSEPTLEIELEQTLPAPTIETVEPEAIVELEHEPYPSPEIELTLLAPITDITSDVAPAPALHPGPKIVPQHPMPTLAMPQEFVPACYREHPALGLF